MATKKTIKWSLNAMSLLGELYDYLAESIGDIAAQAYLDELMDFGNSLETKSTHHSYCRNQKLQMAGCRCALFRKKYIIIYMEDAYRVKILGVMHSKRSPQSFEDLLN